MKILPFLLFLMIYFTLNAGVIKDECPKDWSGELKIGSMCLPIVLHIKEEGEALAVTLDSPDQGAFAIPAESVTFEDNLLRFKISALHAEYTGTLKNDQISGTFIQSGTSLPLIFNAQSFIRNRPQEPKAPLPYLEKNVSYKNQEAGVTLSGTLTFPKGKGPFPAVILITGSGPHDRDETIFGHKPFLVLADHLTRLGVAVLRVDDRGVGESTGTFEGATSKDFATDVLAGIDFLKNSKEINVKKIGLIGHSEGGLIAPIVAAQSKDVSFVVLMAGTGVTGAEVLYEQSSLLQEISNVSRSEILESQKLQKKLFNIVMKESDCKVAEKELRLAILEHYPKGENLAESDLTAQVRSVNSEWFRYFLKHQPVEFLNKVTVPVLALNGELDLQVSATQNLPAISKALEEGGNRDCKIVTLPQLNHLFQTCKTGSPSEYGEIEETISPIALKVISDWILEKTELFSR